MNIFATSNCPTECARALDDKRLVKMVLETAQILSTVLGVGYKPTHVNHPCTVWARYNYYNTAWVWRHFDSLSDEYTHRYGKVHKSCRECNRTFYYVLKASELTHAPLLDGRETLTPHIRAMDHDLKHDETITTHEAYQIYLCRKWQDDQRSPKWTNRDEPAWRQQWATNQELMNP